MFRLLRHRNLPVLHRQGISRSWLTLVVQSLLVLHLGGNGLSVGVLSACQFLPVLLSYLVRRSGVGPLRPSSVCSSSCSRSPWHSRSRWRSWESIFRLDRYGRDGQRDSDGIRQSCAPVAVLFELVDESEVSNSVGLNSSLMTSSRVIRTGYCRDPDRNGRLRMVLRGRRAS